MEQTSRWLLPYPTGRARKLARVPVYLYSLGLGSLTTIWPIMILTTRGRKTGKPRYTALEYRRHGSKFYVVSAWGERPQWYRNLLAYPHATIQIGRQIFNTRAVPLDNPAEAVRVLYMFRRTAPIIYDQILARMSTADSIDLSTLTRISDEFTIMRLDIVQGPAELPVVRINRRWVKRAVLGSLALSVALLALALRSRR